MQNVTIKMKSKKLYWKGIEQLNSESTIVEGLENNEFVWQMKDAYGKTKDSHKKTKIHIGSKRFI